MDIGSQLRTSREARRLSLEAVARTTRVQRRILAAIEQNDATAIPPRPFGRGFVHAYAREVGLNPEQTVRDYFNQFAAPIVEPAVAERIPQAKRPALDSRSFAGPAAAIGIALLVVTALALRQSARPSRDAGAVGTTGNGAPVPVAARADASHVPVDRSTPAPAVVKTPAEPIRIVITATAPCWVTAKTDGHRVLYQLLKPGDQSTLTAQNDVTIRAGDAAALTWTINGRTAGTLGAPGAVRNATVTPANAASIK